MSDIATRAGQTLDGTETELLEGLPVWLGFNVFVAALFVFDLFVLTRRDHIVSMREAGILTALWTGVGVAVGAWIFISGTSGQGIEYTAAYVANQALSGDNLFVFLIIFGYFRLPPQYQSRALLFGIIGALLARAVFIAVGVAVINAFSWFLIVLGVFLIYTAYKVAFSGGDDVDPGKNLAVKWFRKLMPVADEYDGHHFFTRLPSGAKAATPFLLVVIALATTDVMFAVDSVPTVFSISKDPFVVWSSNAMAILAMRPVLFLLAGLVRIFKYLPHGLALILAFLGVKMVGEEAYREIAHHAFHLISEQGDILLSLGVIIFVLAGSVVASMLFQRTTSHPAPSVGNENSSG